MLNRVKLKHKPKKSLCVHVLVLSGDGFKSSSCLDDEDSEDAFCGDIHDGVQASFHGGRNHSLTFSNDPDNWVQSPKNKTEKTSKAWQKWIQETWKTSKQ